MSNLTNAELNRAAPGYELFESLLGVDVNVYLKRGPILRGKLIRISGNVMILDGTQKDCHVTLESVGSIEKMDQ
jgi:hypothetical protein